MSEIAYRAADYGVVFDGQSLNGNPFGENTYPITVMSTRNGVAAVDRPWIGGYAWNQLYAGAPSGSFPFTERCAPYCKIAPYVVYIQLGGTTSYALGVSGASVYASEGDCAAAARAAGADYVIGTTTTPSTQITGGNETKRLAGNALVLADASGYFDAVVDLAGHADLDDSSDTNFYVDGTHLAPGGITLVASLIGTALDAALAAAGITP